MMHKKDLAVLILSGGQSSRMGRDKALIEVQGMPLLQRVCEVALQLSDSIAVMNGGNVEHLAVLPASVQVILETERQGPLVAFAQGIEAVKADWILLLACDLPCLEGEPLRSQIKKLPTVADSVMAVLPRHEKGWEPLCGFYRRTCADGLKAFVAAGGRSFQRWLMTQQVEELEIEPRMLANCNTIADLEEVMKESGRQEGI
jgi:molybdenum cofactor guanylyltransferase